MKQMSLKQIESRDKANRFLALCSYIPNKEYLESFRYIILKRITELKDIIDNTQMHPSTVKISKITLEYNRFLYDILNR